MSEPRSSGLEEGYLFPFSYLFVTNSGKRLVRRQVRFVWYKKIAESEEEFPRDLFAKRYFVSRGFINDDKFIAATSVDWVYENITDSHLSLLPSLAVGFGPCPLTHLQ